MCVNMCLVHSETMDESSQEVRVKFADEIFRTETRETPSLNGDTPDTQGQNSIPP